MVPRFLANPLGAIGSEFQACSMRGCSSEDPVAAAKVLLHLLGANLNGKFVEYSNGLNGIERKRAECVLTVAPSIENPVLSIVHQLLRRNNSSCALLALPISILHVQALAFHQSASYLLEVLGLDPAGSEMN